MRKKEVLEKKVKEIWFNQLYPLWANYYSNCKNNVEDNPIYLPGIPTIPKEESLLIIGINPSTSKNYYKQELKGTHYQGKGEYLLKNLRWSRWANKNIKKFDLERIYDIEYTLGKNHPFFVQFERIIKLTNFNYSFLDLLYIRDSNQQNVVNKYLNSKKGSPEELFVREQMEISLKLLEDSKPKAIIIANAETSRVIFRKFKRNITGSIRKNGRYVLSINNNLIPILPLSNMKYLSFGIFYAALNLIENAVNRPIEEDDLISIPENEIEELLDGYKYKSK